MGYELFLTVENMCERTGCTAKAALTYLKTPHEGFSELAKYSVEELQSRYSEAKPHWKRWRMFLKEIDTEIAELQSMAEKIGRVMTREEIVELIHPKSP